MFEVQKKKESKNQKVVKIKEGRKMLSSKSVVFDIKKSRFIKEQKAKELLSSLGIKIPILSEILWGKIFCFKGIKWPKKWTSFL